MENNCTGCTIDKDFCKCCAYETNKSKGTIKGEYKIGVLFTNGHMVEGTFRIKSIALDALNGMAKTIKRYPGTIRNIWSR